MNAAPVWIVLLGCAACAPHYAYTFEIPAAADRDLGADIVVDAKANTIALDLTNRTDQVLQIEWAKVSITDKSGLVTPLRPDWDLGWLQPGASVSAHLYPLALPDRGKAAAAYEGESLELTVPVIVRREAKQYHYSLVAHVHEI